MPRFRKKAIEAELIHRGNFELYIPPLQLFAFAEALDKACLEMRKFTIAIYLSDLPLEDYIDTPMDDDS